MKLATKIVLLFMLGIVLLMAIHAAVTIDREDRRLIEEMEEEVETLGKAVEDAVIVLWRDKGHEGVSEWIAIADRQHEDFSVRWVILDRDARRQRPAVPIEHLRAAEAGTIVSMSRSDQAGHGWHHMYYPINVQNNRVGCLEFSELLADVKQYTRGTMYQSLGAVAATLLCGLLVALVGARIVGRPLEQLIDKTKRIGRGDFSGPLHLAGNDELSQLAQMLNQMCDQLAELQQKISSESAARMAVVEQLRHVDRLKTVGRLASGVAHELGTPLNVVSGRAELIASGRLEGGELLESALAIKSEANRMTTIIGQLLDFARRRSPHRTEVDLRDVVRQSVELLSPLANKQNVTIAIEGDEQSLVAKVDVGQIQQVLTNLIVNAIQAMPEGGRMTVGLRTQQMCPPEGHDRSRGDYDSISVRDEGDGIQPEDLEHLFEPFFTTKDVGAGTGLGLSVSHGIVEDHDGWIDVESEAGKGSCFTVYLPTDPM